jgi:dissimilatory sulfite reductase (desulfoviridin) alpha/beta subunit
MAIDLENRYKGVRSPHKFKGGVSGCVRECAEAQSKDFGLIATDKGWNSESSYLVQSLNQLTTLLPQYSWAATVERILATPTCSLPTSPRPKSLGSSIDL